MAKVGYIYHELYYVVPKLPAGWWAAGEIVGSGASLSQVHAAFLASVGHNAVIHDKRWTHMGVGVAYGSGKWYVSVLFIAHAQWCGVW